MSIKDNNSNSSSRSTATNLFAAVRNRVSRAPLLEAVAGELERESKKFFDKKNLEQNLNALSTKKLSLNHVFLDMAQRADKALKSAMREQDRIAQAEQRMDLQMRKSLEQRLYPERKIVRSRAGKDYVIRGQLLHPETQQPLAGMVVEAVDRDVYRHDRLGVATTDAEGRFEIEFSAADFKESGEGLPEVQISVGVNRTNLKVVEGAVLKPDKGKPSEVSIKLPKQFLKTAEALESAPGLADRQRLRQLRYNQAITNVQHQLMQKAGQSLLTGLAGLMSKLEFKINPAARPAETPAAKAEAEVVPPVVDEARDRIPRDIVTEQEITVEKKTTGKSVLKAGVKPETAKTKEKVETKPKKKAQGKTKTASAVKKAKTRSRKKKPGKK